MTNTNKAIIVIGLIIILSSMPKKTNKVEELRSMSTLEAEKLIKYFEASNNVEKYLTAYQDEANVWTIGWGNTYNYLKKRPVQKGDSITKSQADQFLQITISKLGEELKNVLKVNVNNNQYNALLTWLYNFDIQRLKSSTLLRLLNSGADPKSVAKQFLVWNKIKDVRTGKYRVSDGLATRRKAEADLFLS